MPKAMSYEERFFQKVNKTEYCWLWTGAPNSRGYGCFSYNKKTTLAHHYSYIFHKGEIPDGLIVCHTCDVPACVNPEHLWADTHSANSRDMFNKNRQGTSNRKKDGCRKGHSFEEFEPLIYIKKQGRQVGKEYRVCRECKRINDLKRVGSEDYLVRAREYHHKNRDKINEAKRKQYHARKNKQTPSVGGPRDKATDF